MTHLLSDHAVLQRDRPIHVWGWATPGASIEVEFHGHRTAATTDRIGKWSAWLEPEQAGGPYSMTVSGEGQNLTFHDLLVGDIWLASGQSNMEMPLAGFPGSAVVKDAEREIAVATQPRVRLLVVEKKAADIPVTDVTRGWTECTPETAKNFSAVAYFFARDLAREQGVPVGVIDSTWGGTPADSWVSMDTLGNDARLLPAFASRAQFADEQQDVQTTIDAEHAEDAEAKAEGRPAVKHPWHPNEMSWLPAGLYNGMIAPLTPLEIRGFLWYQGETNSAPERAPFYHSLFSALIGDWRGHFAQGNLPFLFVQISSFDSPHEDWGRVRDEQRRTLDVANTAMAVSLDVGLAGNVHPPDKQTVAQRLELGARALAYRENVEDTGPVFTQATAENGGMRVWFAHADKLRFAEGGENGFEIAGSDHRFVRATAAVEGATVLVRAEGVAEPKYVRYAWNNVVTGSLRNAADLPAGTFTSEP